MTTEEFSNEFDILLNSQSINAPSINLDEYEKSVFLTKAQEELIISMYNGKNPLKDSFEKTEEIRRYLSDLIKTESLIKKLGNYRGLSKNSIFFELPKGLWFITYESATIDDEKAGCKDGTELLVVPVSQDDYFKIERNPFRGANIRRALRLDYGDNLIEIVSKYNINKYLVRYLTKPTPIILGVLPNPLTINGESTVMECALNPAIHRAILERAVQLALISKSSNTGDK